MSQINSQPDLLLQQYLNSEEKDLYQELGKRTIAMAGDPTLAGSFEPPLAFVASDSELLTFQELGHRLFNRLSLEAYKLVCDPEGSVDRGKLLSAFGIDQVAVAAALTALLISNLGLEDRNCSCGGCYSY